MSRFHDDDRELLELIDAELDRQEAIDRLEDRRRERADAPDQLAAYRLPDGTIDVDALELGQPTPGWFGVGLETMPNYATGRPPAPRRMIPVDEGTFVLEEWTDGVTLEAQARAALEASRARRRPHRGPLDPWKVGAFILIVLSAVTVALILVGVVRGLT